MPYSSSEESATSAVPDVGRRQVGHVADGAPVVGRQRGHRLCGRVRVRLCRYCVASGDLNEGATLSFIPKDKLSRRAFVLAVMTDVVPGRKTMHYGVEVSWALPLEVAHSGEAKCPGASLSRRSWFIRHRAS